MSFWKTLFGAKGDYQSVQSRLKAKQPSNVLGNALALGPKAHTNPRLLSPDELKAMEERREELVRLAKAKCLAKTEAETQKDYKVADNPDGSVVISGLSRYARVRIEPSVRCLSCGIRFYPRIETHIGSGGIQSNNAECLCGRMYNWEWRPNSDGGQLTVWALSNRRSASILGLLSLLPLQTALDSPLGRSPRCNRCSKVLTNWFYDFESIEFSSRIGAQCPLCGHFFCIEHFAPNTKDSEIACPDCHQIEKYLVWLNEGSPSQEVVQEKGHIYERSPLLLRPGTPIVRDYGPGRHSQRTETSAAPIEPLDGRRECKRGHGPLREWEGTLRCWLCGWPFK